MNKPGNSLAVLAILAATACTHAKVATAPATPAPVETPVETAIAAPALDATPQESWKTVLTEKPVLIEGANFATNSARMLKAAETRLAEVVDTARQHPEIALEVSGHTDNIGSQEENQKLSELRAAYVKMWLVEHGIAEDRISTAGYGYLKPIASNRTAAGRATNRRVEIRYVFEEEKQVSATE
jgi:OOP family OmpA-OmpF porin